MTMTDNSFLLLFLIDFRDSWQEDILGYYSHMNQNLFRLVKCKHGDPLLFFVLKLFTNIQISLNARLS